MLSYYGNDPDDQWVDGDWQDEAPSLEDELDDGSVPNIAGLSAELRSSLGAAAIIWIAQKVDETGTDPGEAFRHILESTKALYAAYEQEQRS